MTFHKDKYDKLFNVSVKIFQTFVLHYAVCLDQNHVRIDFELNFTPEYQGSQVQD